MSGPRGVRGWLLRAPVGLREGSENTLLAPSGDFEIGEARLGKSLAGFDALQHPGWAYHGPSASWFLHSIHGIRDIYGIAEGTKKRGSMRVRVSCKLTIRHRQT